MRGVINLRGSVVPVLDLKMKFGLGTTDKTIDTSVIVTEMKMDDETVVIGLLTDAVNEVLELNEDEIEPTPYMGTRFKASLSRVWEKREKSLSSSWISTVFSAPRRSRPRPWKQAFDNPALKDEQLLTVLKIKDRLNIEFDRVIEDCLNEKLPVRQALKRVLPLICRIIGAREMMIRTMDEDLKPFSFHSKGFQKEWSSILPSPLPEKAFSPRITKLNKVNIILVSLDVTDRLIGICAFAFPGEIPQHI